MEDRQVEVLLEQADVQMRLAQWRSAIDLLRRALAIDPDHARAHAQLALALLGAKRLAGAEIEARLALALESGSSLAHYAAAAVLRAQRRLDEAWEHCEIALTADSADADVYVLGAGIRDLRGEVSEARALLVRALELEPAHAGALTRFARLELDAHRPEEAARYAEEALRARPDDLDAHVVAGLVDLVRGDVAGAEGHARFALTQDATDHDALGLWASIKARRSWTLGLWWRLNAWVSLRSEGGQVALLIGSFVVVQIAIILATAADLPLLEQVLSWAWLGLCAYTWVAPELWKRMLQRDLGTVVLDPDF
ncbi:MAG TPA: tetratricopeptide repeat protein [Kofleriaceae bacterium]|nr:tetratricopeptide repeat protein [Kofleriaceae bacterium]